MAKPRLGPSQCFILQLISDRYSLIDGIRAPAGITKNEMLSRDWKIVDRLTALGLLQEKFVKGQGPTYFATEAGRLRLEEIAAEMSAS